MPETDVWVNLRSSWNVMQGPRSVSAEHDYLVEQIEELKRRLLERNREYESLRRRERRLHNDVFERDERLQQMTLTMTDLEAALQDRTAELRELEDQRSSMEHELNSARRSERTREVVGRASSLTPFPRSKPRKSRAKARTLRQRPRCGTNHQGPNGRRHGKTC